MIVIRGLCTSGIRVRSYHARNFCTSGSSRVYDILVCGGGVVGSAFISSLLHKLHSHQSFDSSSLSIAIIDSSNNTPAISASPTPLLRAYALSPTSIQTLKRIGAWSLIEPRSQPYQSMQVWEGTGPGVVNFEAKDLNVANGELGRICEDATINASIFHSLEPFSGQVDILRQTSLLTLHSPSDADQPKNASSSSKRDFTNNFISATIKNNASGAVDTIKARLVVGADGNNSAVRKLSNIPTWGFEYGQEAVIATVKVELGQGDGDVNNTAWQKYLPTGPLALLPLWGGYSSVVWSTSVAESRRLQALPTDQLAAEIDAALRDNLRFIPHPHRRRQDFSGQSSSLASRAIEEFRNLADGVMAASLVSQPFRSPPAVTAVEGKVASFPLSFQHARRYVAEKGRVTLIGDAAHTIHPQAGQGLNLGLLDVEALSDAVVASILVGEDIGSMRTLTMYESERYWKNLSMMTTVDTINSIFKFGSDSKLSQRYNVLRSFGMLGVNAMAPLKEFIASFAIGKS